MARVGHVVALLLAAGVAMAGLVLGAAIQYEEILHTEIRDQDEANARIATGYLVFLTATLCGLGAAAMLMLLGRAPRARRLGGASAAGAAVYVLVLGAQTAMPNYIIIEDSVTLAITLLANNAPAAASLLLPVVALMGAALWVFVWGARRALGAVPGTGLGALQRRFAGRVLYAVPFLVVGFWGPVQVLVALPAGEASSVAHGAVLSLQILACGGLFAAFLAQAWHLGAAAHEPRLRGYAGESWRIATTFQAAAAAVLLALAAVGALLPRAELDVLHSGTVLGATLRTHPAFVAFLLLAAAPAWSMNRTVREALSERASPHAARHADLGPGIVAAAATAFVVAGVLSWILAGAMWPWLAAASAVLLPARRLGTASSAICLLLAAYILWCIGNTITAGYVQGTDITIRFGTRPGILALWRIGAVLLGALAAVQMWMRGRRVPRSTTMGLAVPAAVMLGFAAMVELPLAAWTIQTLQGEAVGLGSLPASQDAAVQATMHTLSILGGMAAAFLFARAHRPDWFERDGSGAAPAPDPRLAGA